jgi:arsenate reductase
MGVATLYGIRNCDTVKKACAWLEAKGIRYRFHDYKISGVEPELNRAGRESAVVLMLAQPSVIKRPLVELR